ncbi:MAG: hypothetical protein L0G99_02050 [Propionibacteriales bacterium]|nr:hypothetical protein [Propionibacteriales bacterium]
MRRHLVRSCVVLLVSLVIIPATTGCGLINRLPGMPSPDRQKPANALSFHPVLEVNPAPCAAEATVPPGLPDPSSPESSCLRGDQARLTVDRLADVKAEIPPNQTTMTWQVTMTLEPDDAQAMAELTTDLADNSDPQNRLAVLLDEKIITAPAVAGPIAGGTVIITGNYTQQEAEDLARRLGG